MSERDVAFVGSVPENYDRHLASILFNPYAEDLAERLSVRDGMQVLEVACGTGLLTRRLADRLAGRGTLVATDLNAAMIDHGRPDPGGRAGAVAHGRRRRAAVSRPRLRRRRVPVRAHVLPDKAAGMREAHRVLRPDGRYLFNVWDAMEHAPIVRIVDETMLELFPSDPPMFYAIPYGFRDGR